MKKSKVIYNYVLFKKRGYVYSEFKSEIKSFENSIIEFNSILYRVAINELNNDIICYQI
jgi:hypothetical protein